MSKKIIHSMSDYYDQNGTYDGYYAQYPTAKKLKIGETYISQPKQWDELKVKIVEKFRDIFIGEVVAGIPKKGKLLFYHAEGKLAGWMYEDLRPYRRLQNIKKG